jgi:hypothetical protein
MQNEKCKMKNESRAWSARSDRPVRTSVRLGDAIQKPWACALRLMSCSGVTNKKSPREQLRPPSRFEAKRASCRVPGPKAVVFMGFRSGFRKAARGNEKSRQADWHLSAHGLFGYAACLAGLRWIPNGL